VQRHVRGVALALWLTGLVSYILHALLMIGFASKASDFLGITMQTGFLTLLTFGALIVTRQPGDGLALLRYRLLGCPPVHGNRL
jgi:hypothetical protein